MVNQIKNRIGNTRSIFYLLCIGVFATVSLYIYFLGNTIYSVVERNNVEKTIVSNEREIATSEAEYLSLKNSVTHDLAITKGFKVLATTKYISLKQTGKEISYNTAR